MFQFIPMKMKSERNVLFYGLLKTICYLFLKMISWLLNSLKFEYDGWLTAEKAEVDRLHCFRSHWTKVSRGGGSIGVTLSSLQECFGCAVRVREQTVCF